MKYNSTILFLMILVSSTFMVGAQNDKNIETITAKANEACLSLKSIEYKIKQTNAKGKYSFPTIEAVIVQQRADVTDIGFDKAYIKVTGTIKEKSEIENFSYAYNGDNFTYQRGNNETTKINSPKRNIVMGMLQQHLFMLRFFPFTQEEPLKPYANGKYTLEGKENINDKVCYKIMSVSIMKMKNQSSNNKSRSITRKDIWWIDSETYLPIAYSDGFVYKVITILNYE